MTLHTLKYNDDEHEEEEDDDTYEGEDEYDD